MSARGIGVAVERSRERPRRWTGPSFLLLRGAQRGTRSPRVSFLKSRVSEFGRDGLVILSRGATHIAPLAGGAGHPTNGRVSIARLGWHGRKVPTVTTLWLR